MDGNVFHTAVFNKILQEVKRSHPVIQVGHTNYSTRRAMIGSTREARRAGT
jgi:hypothetical protein